MKATVKTLKAQVTFVNDYVLEKSAYQLTIQRRNGYYAIDMHYKNDITRTIRCAYIGNARECDAWLSALQFRHWYMNEPF